MVKSFMLNKAFVLYPSQNDADGNVYDEFNDAELRYRQARDCKS